MRLFRKRDEPDAYRYNELSVDDHDFATGSETSEVPSYGAECTHCHHGSVPGTPSRPVTLPGTTSRPAPAYRDHGTQTSIEPSPCYSTVKATTRSANTINTEQTLGGGDIELEVPAHDHVHRYPPGVIIIKTIDEEGVDMIEEVSVTEEKSRSHNASESNRLNGTGLDEGAIEKLAGKFINTMTR
ncbi:hypothetical protein NX059_000384 [Plenodomus lindquistii]|nr:hypothetical protein NX059_000384 [Plenodomus lindquistii]